MPPSKKASVKKVADVINEPETGVSPDGISIGLGKVRKLVIRNYCCIGNDPVEIDLDRIVVLVGPNNAGKSTVLKAYNTIMSDEQPKLSLEEFWNGKCDPTRPPTIELHTAFPDTVAASHWIQKIEGESIVRERWVWTEPGQPGKRQGFKPALNDWSDEKPFGFDNVAKSKRPRPHRIHAFASPEKQAKEVADLLLKGITSELKKMPRTRQGQNGAEEPTEYGRLLSTLGQLQTAMVKDAEDKIGAAEKAMGNFVAEVFPGYTVSFDARPEEDLEKAFDFFQAGAELRMGPTGGHLSSVENQGSGARRTLLWAALRYIAENGKGADTSRPNVLLLDEPELCLHPNAVRQACRTLYELAEGDRWQVMITTHSPTFIDLSRDNTTVVRVERCDTGRVIGTTVFRPSKLKLDEEEKRELKLLNLFDPSVAEFFFGGQTVIVEGDTEHTALKYVAGLPENEHRFRALHVIRARGKVTIALLARILNQFQARYAIIHDSDTPKAKRKGKEIANPAWTNNSKILSEVQAASDKSRIRLVATVPHFEAAMFGSSAATEKPYGALEKLRSESGAVEKATALLEAITDFAKPLPKGWVEWTAIGDLEEEVRKHEGATSVDEPDAGEPGEHGTGDNS
jgi:putative ATP-dependent endonuclease of the OLD family